MLRYEKLSEETELRIKTNRENKAMPQMGFDEEKVIRRDNGRDKANLIRTAFIRALTK